MSTIARGKGKGKAGSSSNTNHGMGSAHGLSTDGPDHYLQSERTKAYGPLSPLQGKAGPDTSPAVRTLYHDMYKSGLCADVEIVLEGLDGADGDDLGGKDVVLRAHRSFLCLHSGMWRYLLEVEDGAAASSGAAVLEHSGEDGQGGGMFRMVVKRGTQSVGVLRAMEVAVGWCYGGTLPVTNVELCYSLLAVAQFWLMPMLTEHVMQWVGQEHDAETLVRMCRGGSRVGAMGVAEVVHSNVYHASVLRVAMEWSKVADAVSGGKVARGAFAFMRGCVFVAMVKVALEQHGEKRVDKRKLARVVGGYLDSVDVEEMVEAEEVEYLSGLLDGVKHHEDMGLLKVALTKGASEDVVRGLCVTIAGKLDDIREDGRVNLSGLPVWVAELILSADGIDVRSEDDVLEIVERYVEDHDGEGEEGGWERRMYGCVRFGLLSPERLERMKVDGEWDTRYVDLEVLVDGLLDALRCTRGQEPVNSKKREFGGEIIPSLDWDRVDKSRGTFTENSLDVTGGSYTTWVGKKQLRSGQRWSVRVDRLNFSAIGICNSSCDLRSKAVGGMRGSYSWYSCASSGQTRRNGSYTSVNTHYNQGDIVTVEVDTTAHTLTFSRNGNVDVTIDNIGDDTWYPAFSCHTSKMTIVPTP